ncbi:MAG: hypothetical protein IPG33_02880 [Betaproteobacteria bacterium]|nr:hypothetical protein [Betaproteobacteria bacterium]
MDQKTKITAKIYAPQLHDFNRQIDVLCIKRDAFLNKVINYELDHLAADMAGKRLSPEAKKFISRELKRMGTVPVNMVVGKLVAKRLNEIVETSNLVRDAFINRLLLLLRSSPKLLDYLDLPEFVTDSSFTSIVQPMPTGPLQAIKEVNSDPLFYLRIASRERHKTGLYLLSLPPKLTGFACFIDDQRVPKTNANVEWQSDINTAFDELASLESDAFSKQPNQLESMS